MTAVRYSNTASLALCGLFAAITAVCSFISIPLGFTPVPVNLATLAVFLAGGLLGKKYGTIALAVYTLLGAVGIPVFAGFRGGLSVLAGPTGGYIIGYIAAAFLVGLIIEKGLSARRQAKAGHAALEAVQAEETAGQAPEARASGKIREYVVCVIAMIAGLAVCYLLGTAWFIITTNTGVWASLLSCVIPFLPGDALKIAAATILVQKLRRYL